MSDHSFGSWLRQRRKSYDLTQVELASRAGCAVGTLRNIEADDARPSKQLAARLAQVLGVADADSAALVAFARGMGFAPIPALIEPNIPQPPKPVAPHSAQPSSTLPLQLTELIGRTREVNDVCALLVRSDVRLVTLTGPGGTGKTRVAIQVVDALRAHFADGVYFIDLAAMSDAGLVLATIARTLGVAEGGEQPLAVHIGAVVRDHTVLVLLDNFEQVVDAAPAITEIMAVCPHMKVIVTSRIALGINGEHEWPVPPLALPDRALLPPLEQLTRYESIRLFSTRARAVNPAFALTSNNAPAVAEICHQLDGLPLAIELAAARTKLFQPQALLVRLDHGLSFVSGRGEDRPTRQQTIRHTIAWSYHLLTPDEQQLFQRLSIFHGGATLAAIAAVCHDTATATDSVYGVATLVNHSLLRRLSAAGDGDDAADPRFGMLETIRAYAAEQRTANAANAALALRHAQYFSVLAETAAAAWDTPAINVAIARQRQEYDNMRAALQWACDHGETALGSRLAMALWGFWRSYGYGREGRVWLERLLQQDAHPVDRAALATRRRLLHAAAWLASDQHAYGTATRLFEESSALRHALGEGAGEIDLLLHAARQARAEGQYQRATGFLQDAFTYYRLPPAPTRSPNAEPPPSSHLHGQLLREHALVLRERGDFAAASALLENAVALARAGTDRVSEALALLGLGDVARDQGDAVRVRAWCAPSLVIFRESTMEWAIGFTLNNLALAAAYTDDLAQAAELADACVAIFQRLHADGSLAEVLITQAFIMRAHGNVAAAHTALIAALRIARAVGPRLIIAAALEALGHIALHNRQAPLTVQLLAGAAKLREHMGAPVRPMDRAALEHTRTTAQSALGDEAYASLWTTAHAQPLEQLLDRVLPFGSDHKRPDDSRK